MNKNTLKNRGSESPASLTFKLGDYEHILVN